MRKSLFSTRLLPAASLCVLGAGLLASAPTASASGGKGLTFGLYSHDPVLGVDHVGYDGTGNPNTGDTLCGMARPILCTDVDGSGRPNYDVLPAGNQFYQGWVEGHYTTTKPTKGTQLVSEVNADKICASAFGTGWRMAEWHDGVYIAGMDAHNVGNTIGSNSPWPNGPDPSKAHGGSTQWGFGNIRSDTRYWVAINDHSGQLLEPLRTPAVWGAALAPQTNGSW